MRMKYRTEEEDHQKMLVQWLNLNKIRFCASANGGSRNLYEAVKLKKMGISPGFPDIEIPLPRGKYHGLYIEMKRCDGGVVSQPQKEWIDYLNKNGYMAKVCKGFDEAKLVIETYINEKEFKSDGKQVLQE